MKTARLLNCLLMFLLFLIHPAFAVTDTDTPTATVTDTYTATPTLTPTQTACACEKYLGRTDVGSSSADISGRIHVNRNYFYSGTDSYATGIMVYVAVTNGTAKMRAAIYQAAGMNHGPPKAQSNEITPVVGWNYLDIPDTLINSMLWPQGILIAMNTEPGIEIAFDNTALPPDEHQISINPVPYGLFGFLSTDLNSGNTRKYSAYVIYCPVDCNVTPTNTPSLSQTPVYSPTVTPTFQPPTGTCDAEGNTHAGSFTDNTQPYGKMLASRYFLSQGIVQQIAVYCSAGAGGNISAAIYADFAGAPGAKLAQAGSKAMVNGWNMVPVNLAVMLPGNYWLAFQFSVNGVTFNYDTAGVPLNSANEDWAGGAFPAWPASWGFSTPSTKYWSIYADICAFATPTVTSTVTPYVTQTVTRTETPAVTATATPSLTLTETAAVTPVYTVTETVTPASSATASTTPSYTITITETWTSSVVSTATNTPAVTVSSTGSPVLSQTNTPVNTATNTPVNTASVTASGSPTTINTETPVNSPANTATRTPTFTPTVTQSAGYTPTITSSATPTFTITPTNTPSFTRTFTPTFTLTFTPTVSASVTETATHTITGTVTETHTVSPVVSSTITPAITETMTEMPSLTTTSTFTPGVTGTITETETPVITDTPAYTDTPTTVNSATLTITITLTPNPLSPTPTLTLTCGCVPTATRTPTLAPTVQPDQLVIYPCPASNAVTVSIKDNKGGNKAMLTIYTNALRKVFKKEYPMAVPDRYTADVTSLSAGTYIMSVEIYNWNNRVYREIKPVIIVK